MPLERVRLVQLSHASNGRRVGVVEESKLPLLRDTASVYELALNITRTYQALRDGSISRNE